MKKNILRRGAQLLIPAALSLLAANASADDIVRHKLPGSDFPIALAVSVPAMATLHFISGQVPSVVDKAATADSLAAFGDTRTQSESVLKKIKDVLTGLGLTMGDVVEMQVFLVGDPAKGGHAQPNLPTRAVVQVAGLSSPGWLVEIQVIAAKK